MELISPKVHIMLPDCYLAGQLNQLTGRNDIGLNLYDKKQPYMKCRVPGKLFGEDIVFTAHKFHTHCKTIGSKTWWHFRRKESVEVNTNEGAVTMWLIDFFTKSAGLKLQTIRDFGTRNRFSL